jgi:hypothetical protein
VSPADDIRAARERCLVVLGEIAQLAAERSLTRCPYRARLDACTFTGGCRNQLLSDAQRRCAGGLLNPLPASSHLGRTEQRL